MEVPYRPHRWSRAGLDPYGDHTKTLRSLYLLRQGVSRPPHGPLGLPSGSAPSEATGYRWVCLPGYRVVRAIATISRVQSTGRLPYCT